jgi:hypothetical protein
MNRLDYEQLDRIGYRNFRRRKSFPWSNPSGVLREDAFHHLIENLPDVSLFERRQGYTRDYGQKGHDRYSLEYRENLDIDACWHEFVEELQQSNYRRFLHRVYGVRPMKLAFHWHYTKNGNTVSHHCDSKRKIGNPNGVVKPLSSTMMAASTASPRRIIATSTNSLLRILSAIKA